MLKFESASLRSINSLQHWLDDNCCLARAETAYLLKRRDLIGLNMPKDTAIDNLAAWVENRLIWTGKRLKLVQRRIYVPNQHRPFTKNAFRTNVSKSRTTPMYTYSLIA